MKREQLSDIICGIDDRHVAEAIQFDPGLCKRSPERMVHMKKRRTFALAIAAVLVFALSITAYAAYQSVATPEAARSVAQEQLAVWKQMGLLSDRVELAPEADTVTESAESVGDDYWYGRFFTHRYNVLWDAGQTSGPKYGAMLSVDTLSGKIMTLVIDARPDEGVAPVRTEGGYSYYDNYADIFPEDMTVDRFCTLLAEYWGFSGYTLAGTADETYGTDYAAIDGATRLKDINDVTGENYYLTVFFEGDQAGAPMYVQLVQYPGFVTLIVGTGHGVG